MNTTWNILCVIKKVINLSLSKFQNRVDLGQQNEHCLCTTIAILDGYLLVVITYVIFWASALENRNSRYTAVGHSCVETAGKYRLFKPYLLVCSVALLFPAPAWYLLGTAGWHTAVQTRRRAAAKPCCHRPHARQQRPCSEHPPSQDNAPPTTVSPLHESMHQVRAEMRGSAIQYCHP